MAKKVKVKVKTNVGAPCAEYFDESFYDDSGSSKYDEKKKKQQRDQRRREKEVGLEVDRD